MPIFIFFSALITASILFSVCVCVGGARLFLCRHKTKKQVDKFSCHMFSSMMRNLVGAFTLKTDYNCSASNNSKTNRRVILYCSLMSDTEMCVP